MFFMNIKELGNYFAKKRRDSGLSQKKLAEMLGYGNWQIISNVERGDADLPKKKAFEWLQLIGADRKKVCSAYVKEYTNNLKEMYKL